MLVLQRRLISRINQRMTESNSHLTSPSHSRRSIRNYQKPVYIIDGFLIINSVIPLKKGIYSLLKYYLKQQNTREIPVFTGMTNIIFYNSYELMVLPQTVSP